MHKIGFLINPIAGMGGKVGLKGTDGKLEQALKLGATPIAKNRASDFFSYLLQILSEQDRNQIHFIVPPGKMGEQIVRDFWNDYSTLTLSIDEKTTAEDTIKAVKLMLEKSVELIVFVGGDGTSIDVYHVVEDRIPILGVPSGVKIFGSVFAKTPEAAANSLKNFIKERKTVKAEVMDIDEQDYREGTLSADLKGMALVPQSPENMQTSKHGSPRTQDEKGAQGAIARYVLEKYVQHGIVFILGPGTTTKTITDQLNLSKTPLGVDILKNGEIIASDVNETQILEVIKSEDQVKIIVTPLGHQGSLFGRGNQQISAKVIRKVGRTNIIILATKNKLASLEDKHLYVDTYDEEVNELLSGYIRVITDYKETTMVKIE